MIYRKYGWKRSKTPSNLPTYAIPAQHFGGANLPASVDLTAQCPPVYDQLSLGSCTANALAGLFQFLLIKLGMASWVPSRLFIYYGERAIEGTTQTDSGAFGSDGVTVLQTDGVCPETLWPYNINEFAVDPPPAAFEQALNAKLLGAVTIADGDIASIKSCLASGYPVAFGFTVYEEIESDAVAASGVLPDPTPGEGSIGGHEVCLVGYDDASQRFRARNSWGPTWGQAGYFTISYAYVGNTSLASDFRSATGITGAPAPIPVPPAPIPVPPTPAPAVNRVLTMVDSITGDLISVDWDHRVIATPGGNFVQINNNPPVEPLPPIPLPNPAR